MKDSASRSSESVARRRFLEVAGATGLSAFLAGCSESDTGKSTTSDGGGGTTTGTKKSGSFTLTYVDVDGDRTKEQFQPVIDDLNSKYDVTVKLSWEEIPYANMKQELLTRIGGGNEPDVAAIDQIWLGPFYQSGKLMSFNDMRGQLNLDDYFDGFGSAIEQNGDIVGFPITTDVRGMYWNKDQFDQAGLDPDSPPKTWSEFYEVGKQLHDPPNRYGTGVIVASGIYSVPLFAAGGQFLSSDGTKPAFQNDAGVEAATFFDEIHNGQDFGPRNPIYGDNSLPQEFLNGTYATTPVYGSWMDYFGRQQGLTDEEMKRKFGFALTPHPADGSPATMNGGFAWSAFNTTERPDIVKDFMSAISSKEFGRKISVETGRIPTRKSLLDVDEVWSNILWSDTIKGMLEHGGTRPVNNWSAVSETLNPALQRIAFDKADPKPALQKAADDLKGQL